MKRTIIETAIPYALIWDKGQVQVRITNNLYVVRFKRRFRQEGDESTIPGVGSASNVELRYDRLARAAHTVLKILFPTCIDDQKDLLRQIHAVLNRLVEVYRFTTGEFFVDVIPKNELWPLDVSTLNDDGSLSPDIAHIETFGYGLTIARKASISLLALQLLENGTELPIPRTLYLNARRAELLENYRIAVVEAEAAFETRVDEVVSQYYKREGASTVEVANKLSAALRNLLKDHIPTCCGKQFVGTQEHSAWDQDLYQLRNAVVHDGASVDADQAKKALDAAEKALKWFQQPNDLESSTA